MRVPKMMRIHADLDTQRRYKMFLTGFYHFGGKIFLDHKNNRKCYAESMVTMVTIIKGL
jgi:hypothetical protein